MRSVKKINFSLVQGQLLFTGEVIENIAFEKMSVETFVKKDLTFSFVSDLLVDNIAVINGHMSLFQKLYWPAFCYE